MFEDSGSPFPGLKSDPKRDVLTPNPSSLAKHIYALRMNDTVSEDDEGEIEEMETMIRKNSAFSKHVPGSSPAPEGHVIILTGSTGSLGAHILAALLTRSDVRNVYCLVRGENPRERVLEALRQRDLSIPDANLLVALTSDLSKKDLGLSCDILNKLQCETTIIIHRYVSFPIVPPKLVQKRAFYLGRGVLSPRLCSSVY